MEKEPYKKTAQELEKIQRDLEELSIKIVDLSKENRVLKDQLEMVKHAPTYLLANTIAFPFRYIYNFFFRKTTFVETKFWIHIRLFLMGITKPISLLRHINKPNYLTLKNAIGNEPINQIFRNFNRLLKNKQVSFQDDYTLAIENIAQINKQINSVILSRSNVVKETQLNILYISPNLPDYDTSSGGRRATKMLELLGQDYNVYAFTHGSKPQKYIDKLISMNVKVLETTEYDLIKSQISDFHVIIYAWFYTYFDADKFRSLYPSAKVIVDSVDINWVREERSVGILNGLTIEKVLEKKKLELLVYDNADLVWAVTEDDKNAIIKELPNTKIEIVSNIHEPVSDIYIDNKKNSLLFIGGYNHYPNLSAVQKLATDIFPIVRATIPDAQLIIAGSQAPESVQELGLLRGIEFRGFVEEEDLDDLYIRDTFLSVSPLLTGAGIKGKICEAIAYNKPVVTSSIGNEGINLIHESEGLITDNDEEMAALIIKALKREYDFEVMTLNARKKMENLVGPTFVKKQMIKSISPEISICIVTYNKMDLLQRCIESIEGNTRYSHYKIIVYSNGCTDGTVEYVEAAQKINPKIIPILSKTNNVFVRPCNEMMNLFPDNDIVLLNNDTYVTNGWLSNLHKAAYASDDIGIAGSKVLYPDGVLQEFGSELYADGSGRNIGKWENASEAAYNKITFVGYVSGCSMFIKRSTIEKIGVFDDQFHPCYCEDSDYCYTAWEKGIRTVVTHKSIIYHEEGGTSGTDTSKGFKAYQNINFEKFLKKHKKNLKQISEGIQALNEGKEESEITLYS